MMNSTIEYSIRDRSTIMMRPLQLCCIRCRLGGGGEQVLECAKVDRLIEQIRENPDTHICLYTAFDEIGARTDQFEKMSAMDRYRDLVVLQKLGLVPYSTRTARMLFDRLQLDLPELGDLCNPVPNSKKWIKCPLSHGTFYKKNVTPVIKRDLEEKARVKHESCDQIEQADTITIRIHHLLCITCFFSNKDKTVPIEEDNLYEVWEKMRKNPKIPVTVLEGCRSCMVCPPCHAFDMERGICNGACALRDRRKDLETFAKLDMLPGETLPAGELLEKIYRNITTTVGICDYGKDTAYEWNACGGGKDNYKRYVEGRAYCMQQMGFDFD